MTKHNNFKSSSWYYLMAVLAVLYLISTWFAPIDPAAIAKYNSSVAAFNLIKMTFAVPILIIWAVAAYGAVSFKRYACTIREAADGRALDTAATGLIVLVFGSAVSSIVQSLRSYVMHSSSIAPVTIVSNEINILTSLVAFYLIWRGSAALAEQVKQKGELKNKNLLTLVALALIAAVYVLLSLHNPNRTIAVTEGSTATYYLSDPLILLLVAVPVIASWTLGILSVVHMKRYLQGVKGALYRSALQGLVNGLFAVILFSIGIQLFTAVGYLLANYKLNALLGVIYLILIAYAIGYVIIARGATKLRAMEEVI